MKKENSPLNRFDIEKAERIAYLVAKFIGNDLTATERDELDHWVAESDDNVLLFEKLIDPENILLVTDFLNRVQVDKKLSKIKKSVNFSGKRKNTWIKHILPYAVAASVIGVIILAVVQIHSQKNDSTPLVSSNDIKAGSNRASLTLVDGSVIVLDKANIGELAKEGNVNLVKQDSTLLSYSLTGNKSNITGYNELFVPRGGQFQVILPDHTHVWLNAGSSLKYPVAFDGSKREVELKGEGYFEVSRDIYKPFYVKTGNTIVEVVGTHFNINAYDDEDEITTTLLEGAVIVRTPDHNAVIKPGQKATVSKVSPAIKVSEAANSQQIIAWKNGLFQFDGADIHLIMRQLARWYDVEITYNLPLKTKTFSGKIARTSNASQVLDMLTYAGIHFKIENKKIIVMQ